MGKSKVAPDTGSLWFLMRQGVRQRAQQEGNGIRKAMVLESLSSCYVTAVEGYAVVSGAVDTTLVEEKWRYVHEDIKNYLKPLGIPPGY